MSTAIKAENLSKAYQLGEIGSGTISRDLERYWAKLRGKEDPFLRIGETSASASTSKNDMVWSLKDINFEINQGDAVGIIGRNGAGKSTLLKILSRVTAPTTGSIKVKGRIASLLEVGTGFHPELTGRENIFLNGAILGMRKAEIKKHFDAIVDFAGVERYIDTPVKRYSSGMYVRLAFAVAAHLESEILVVDEVLAVGDAEFQKKCLGKMGDLSKGEGRTVLFVSHNMGAVKQLCTKGILLKDGLINEIGEINNCIEEYLIKTTKNYRFKTPSNNLTKPNLTTINLNEIEILKNNLHIDFEYKTPFELNPPTFGILVTNYLEQPVFASNSRFHNNNLLILNALEGNVKFVYNDLPLFPGTYNVSCYIGDNLQDLNSYINILTFVIEDLNIDNSKIPNATFIGSINLRNSMWLKK
jgi:lipopolysaccharide transport system ATP-binding protein